MRQANGKNVLSTISNILKSMKPAIALPPANINADPNPIIPNIGPMFRFMLSLLKSDGSMSKRIPAIVMIATVLNAATVTISDTHFKEDTLKINEVRNS
jgi:hypothetical protein